MAEFQVTAASTRHGAGGIGRARTTGSELLVTSAHLQRPNEKRPNQLETADSSSLKPTTPTSPHCSKPSASTWQRPPIPSRVSSGRTFGMPSLRPRQSRDATAPDADCRSRSGTARSAALDRCAAASASDRGHTACPTAHREGEFGARAVRRPNRFVCRVAPWEAKLVERALGCSNANGGDRRWSSP